MEDEISPGPHTEGGRQDMLLHGKCLERQDADGNWQHIPMEQWIWPPPEELPFAHLYRKPLLP